MELTPKEIRYIAKLKSSTTIFSWLFCLAPMVVVGLLLGLENYYWTDETYPIALILGALFIISVVTWQFERRIFRKLIFKLEAAQQQKTS